MKVLFVCSGNSYRSPVAEALFKKARPDIDVDSAGAYGAFPISDETREYLAREKCLEYLKRCPDCLEEKELGEYDLIVAMKQEHRNIILSRCPSCTDKVVVWNIDDPYPIPNAERIFKLIQEKVLQLANSC